MVSRVVSVLAGGSVPADLHPWELYEISRHLIQLAGLPGASQLRVPVAVQKTYQAYVRAFGQILNGLRGHREHATLPFQYTDLAELRQFVEEYAMRGEDPSKYFRTLMLQTPYMVPFPQEVLLYPWKSQELLEVAQRVETARCTVFPSLIRCIENDAEIVADDADARQGAYFGTGVLYNRGRVVNFWEVARRYAVLDPRVRSRLGGLEANMHLRHWFAGQRVGYDWLEPAVYANFPDYLGRVCVLSIAQNLQVDPTVLGTCLLAGFAQDLVRFDVVFFTQTRTLLQALDLAILQDRPSYSLLLAFQRYFYLVTAYSVTPANQPTLLKVLLEGRLSKLEIPGFCDKNTPDEATMRRFAQAFQLVCELASNRSYVPHLLTLLHLLWTTQYPEACEELVRSVYSTARLSADISWLPLVIRYCQLHPFTERQVREIWPRCYEGDRGLAEALRQFSAQVVCAQLGGLDVLQSTLFEAFANQKVSSRVVRETAHLRRFYETSYGDDGDVWLQLLQQFLFVIKIRGLTREDDADLLALLIANRERRWGVFPGFEQRRWEREPQDGGKFSRAWRKMRGVVSSERGHLQGQSPLALSLLLLFWQAVDQQALFDLYDALTFERVEHIEFFVSFCTRIGRYITSQWAMLFSEGRFSSSSDLRQRLGDFARMALEVTLSDPLAQSPLGARLWMTEASRAIFLQKLQDPMVAAAVCGVLHQGHAEEDGALMADGIPEFVNAIRGFLQIVRERWVEREKYPTLFEMILVAESVDAAPALDVDVDVEVRAPLGGEEELGEEGGFTDCWRFLEEAFLPQGETFARRGEIARRVCTDRTMWPLLNFLLHSEKKGAWFQLLAQLRERTNIGLSPRGVLQFCKMHETRIQEGVIGQFGVLYAALATQLQGYGVTEGVESLCLVPPLENVDLLLANDNLLEEVTSFLRTLNALSQPIDLQILRMYLLRPNPALAALLYPPNPFAITVSQELLRRVLDNETPYVRYRGDATDKRWLQTAISFTKADRESYGWDDGQTLLGCLGYLAALKDPRIAEDERLAQVIVGRTFMIQLEGHMPRLNGELALFLQSHLPSSLPDVGALAWVREEFWRQLMQGRQLYRVDIEALTRRLESFTTALMQGISDQRDVYFAKFMQFFRAASAPPIQPLTDALHIAGLTDDGPIWDADHLATHEGQLWQLSREVALWLGWDILGRDRTFSVSFFNAEKGRVYTQRVVLNTRFDVLQRDGQEEAFFAALSLLRRVLMQEPQEPLVEESLTTWVESIPNFAQEIATLSLGHGHITTILEFLLELKTVYWKGFIAASLGKEPSYEKRRPLHLVAGDGNIFHARGKRMLMLVPEDRVSHEAREAYASNVSDVTAGRLFDAHTLVEESREWTSLGVQLVICDGEEELPVSCRVFRKGEEDGKLNLVVFKAEIADQEVCFPMQYRRDQLMEKRRFIAHLHRHVLLLKSAVYRALYPLNRDMGVRVPYVRVNFQE